jgi:hypothetical protein
MRSVSTVVAMMLVAVTTGDAQQPDPTGTGGPGRTLILLVDDLHVPFASTPRLRALLKRLVESTAHDGDRISVVSTGSSSVSEHLTDRDRAHAAISRVIGGALKPTELLAATQSASSRAESRRRARTALLTATRVIADLRPAQPAAIVYVSNGYPTLLQAPGAGGGLRDELEEALSELVRVANVVRAPIHTVSPRKVMGTTEQAPDTAEWRTYTERSRDTLRALSSQTAGIAAIDQATLESVTAQLRDFSRR